MKENATQAMANSIKHALERVSISEKIEVVKALSSEILEVPDILEQTIVREGHIRYLLEFYLSDNNLQLEKAIDLMRNNLP